MIKKSFTNNRNEIYDLLFKENSQIVIYSYQKEDLNDDKSTNLKNLLLGIIPEIDCSISELIKEAQLTVLLFKRNNADCLLIANRNSALLQIAIYKYKSIDGICCENLFVSEICLEKHEPSEGKKALYFFVYFFFGDFNHMVSLLDDHVEILKHGKRYRGKCSAIMILKSLRFSKSIRESDCFKINSTFDDYIFEFGSQIIRIPNTDDNIKEIFLEEG